MNLPFWILNIICICDHFSWSKMEKEITSFISILYLDSALIKCSSCSCIVKGGCFLQGCSDEKNVINEKLSSSIFRDCGWLLLYNLVWSINLINEQFSIKCRKKVISSSSINDPSPQPQWLSNTHQLNICRDRAFMTQQWRCISHWHLWSDNF